MASVVVRAAGIGAFLGNYFEASVQLYHCVLIIGIISRPISRKCPENVLESSEVRGAICYAIPAGIQVPATCLWGGALGFVS